MSIGEIVLIIGAVASLLGAGGLGFWYKARQDGKSSLSSSEAAFRKDILAKLEKVETENKALQTTINTQVVEAALRDEKIITLAGTVDKYLPQSLGRERAERLLERCEKRAEQERLAYEGRIAELEKQVAELTRQLEELTKKVDIDEQSA